MTAPRYRRGALAATLVVAASAALLLVVLVGREHRTALAGLDADDTAFFSASKTFADEGDRDLLRANEAMGDKDLKLALHLTRDSERAYKKGLADRRLVTAEKVEQELSSAIAAKHDAHRSRISQVLRNAEQVNAEAEAAAAGAKNKLAAPKLSSAAQVNLLQKSERLMSQRVPATSVKAAAKRIAALAAKSQAAKLATMDDPDAVLGLNPSVAYPPTHTPGNQWDAQPVPKVLDCGPLSNDCNTKQGGEYYSHHKGEKTSAGASKKGVHPHPPTIKAAAAARFAMLAKDSAARERTSIFGQPLLKHTTNAQDASQLEWLKGKDIGQSSSDSFLKDLAEMRVRRVRAQQLAEQQEDGSGMQVAGKTIMTAGDKLDDMQQELNHRREAIFAEYVGPLALMDTKAPLAVTVDRFASEWVPPGGMKVPSMLKVTPLSPDTTPPAAAFKAQPASRLREPAEGIEGMSLEKALDDLNDDQIQLNKERAALFEAAVGGAALPTAVLLNESPAVIEWQGNGSPTVTAASVEPLTGYQPSQKPAGTAAASVTHSKLQPEAQPSVDYMGREFVGGSHPHAPNVPARGKREADVAQYGKSGDDKAMESRWADEKPTVHHENPRSKVADLMKELNVQGVSAESSFTKDPYDTWHPDEPENVAKAKSTTLKVQQPQQKQEQREPSDEYTSATKVFKAASAAYKAAAKTWKDLEIKEAEAQSVQAIFDKHHHGGERNERERAAAPATATAHPSTTTSKHSHTHTHAATATRTESPQQQANKAQAAATRVAAATDKVSGDHARQERGVTAPAAVTRTAPAPPKTEAPARPLKRKGLDQYKANQAHNDLNSFFDSLIAHRVAVGHDRFNAPKHVVHAYVSSRDTERQKEDKLIAAADLHRVSAKELEQAEEQTTKDNDVFAYVGSELPHKTAEDSRQELDDFYDSMPGGKQ